MSPRSTSLLFIAFAVSSAAAELVGNVGTFQGPTCTQQGGCEHEAECDLDGPDVGGASDLKSCKAPTNCDPNESQTCSGYCNNLNSDSALWATTGSMEPRILEPNVKHPQSHPRDISDLVMKQWKSIPNTEGGSSMVTFFGQFLVHDIAITPTLNGELEKILMKETNPIMKPITFKFSEGVGTGAERAFINDVSSYIDLSTVYGSSAEQCDELRSHLNGKMRSMKTVFGETMFIKNGHFVSGDRRAGESVGLSALHAVFLREHNRLAREFARDLGVTNGTGDDDEFLFQKARRWNIAQFQSMVFNEYLPAVLGGVLPKYEGYDETVNSAINIEFSTAASRFGHSQVNNDVFLYFDDKSNLSAPLAQNFFNATLIMKHGIDPVLKGSVRQCHERTDQYIDDSLRDFLFANNEDGMDLAALNINRGRHHLLSPINDYREVFGLEAYTDFSDMLGGTQQCVQDELNVVYPNGISLSDLWVVGLVEPHSSEGGEVSETFKQAMIDQFMKLRDGDRFYYKNLEAGWFTESEIQTIDETTCSDVILRNTEINPSEFPENAFLSEQCCFNDGLASANKVCLKDKVGFVELEWCEIIAGLKDGSICFPGTGGRDCECGFSGTSEETTSSTSTATASTSTSSTSLISPTSDRTLEQTPKITTFHEDAAAKHGKGIITAAVLAFAFVFNIFCDRF